MDNSPLSKLFQVKGRFRRSVHLERDFYTENTLDGYVLTVTARDTLVRIVSTLENENTSKAWSLTGPYGSGKSALALFVSKLLGNPDTLPTQQALELLKREDNSLYKRFKSISSNGKKSLSGFCPVLISGERAPLSLALLRGLDYGLENFGISLNNSLRQNTRKLLQAALDGTPAKASEITYLFNLAPRAIQKSGGQGVLLVIDEVGKFLEYAAQHPTQDDVFVLQMLAEFATRSGQPPLLFLTILHQAFEQYASRLAKSLQEDWAKVQGRFEDIAFVEPTEHVLRLIGSAIERIPDSDEVNLPLPPALDLKPNQLTEDEFSELMRNCLPLHPTVALSIASIFRRFAQNERSLFAFLSSSEAYGLQDFLSNQCYRKDMLPMYSIAHLYDYLNNSIGHRLYASRNGKKWTEIETALEKLQDPSPMLTKLIKTIGVLSIVGETIPNLKASESLLRYALANNTEEDDLKEALKTLKKRSIAIYRRYNKAYVLWQGSDIDIEAKLHEAERHIDTKTDLATNLSRYLPTRPLVARRHLFKTGTLRHFIVRYTDLENFETDLEVPLDEADGLVLYALPRNEHELKQLSEKAISTELKDHKKVLIAIPRTIGTLQEAVTQLASLRWVEENTPELEGDQAARHELAEQQVQAEKEAFDRLIAIFGDNSKDACNWYYQGRLAVNIKSQRSRNAYLSKICDKIYDKTPILQNELINRRKISGTVTAARRELIQAMLKNETKKDLDISGYPPEMSIYRSLLRSTGIHRNESGVWGFYRPKKNNKTKIVHTWKKIEEFFEECEVKRQSIETLYKRLREPPYGVRSGPLPILLCAAMLHYRTEIALYENGSFIADWSMPVFERLLKVPKQFDLKRFQMTGIRSDLFSQFLEMFNRPIETQKPDLLPVVTPLMHSIGQLPKYTLDTQNLSDNAKNLREVVRNTREPDKLLFKQLPEAFGFLAFRADKVMDSKATSDFFTTLQDALSELEQAYEVLLNSIEQLLAKAFNLTSERETLRAELTSRAERLFAVTIETQLKGFLIQVCSGGHDHTGWLEAIATYLAKKPPSAWVDADKAQFEINLSQIARKFRHFEAVSYEKLAHTESSAGEPIRVGITAPNRTEQQRVVTLTSTADEQASEMEDEIRKVFDKFDIDDNPELHIAILARISQKWMQQLDE